MNEVLVLCYHAVSEDWNANLSITPRRLESQLGRLVRRGYRGVTFTEAVSSPPPGKALAVTFDDGYRSVLDRGLPVLERLGLVGSVFVVTRFVGSGRPMSWPGVDRWVGGPHERELVPLDQEGIGRLTGAGWEVGSHTVSHPRLTRLDDPSLAAELSESRSECERLTGARCRSLAYPYGDVDERVVAAAELAGYSAAGALSSRLGAARPLEWPRIGVYYSDGSLRFRAKASPLVRRLRATPAWEILDRVRRS